MTHDSTPLYSQSHPQLIYKLKGEVEVGDVVVRLWKNYCRCGKARDTKPVLGIVRKLLDKHHVEIILIPPSTEYQAVQEDCFETDLLTGESKPSKRGVLKRL